jgi:arsenite oxidase small subunit
MAPADVRAFEPLATRHIATIDKKPASSSVHDSGMALATLLASSTRIREEAMRRCEKLVDVGRRQFLRGAGISAAGVAAAGVMPVDAKAAPGQALVAYPSNRLANVGDLTVNEPLDVTYPDDEAPGVLIKLGTGVTGGVGPDGDIVGFTTVCPHQGFPLIYNAGDKTLNCPGHYSRFDCERSGLEIWGQATQNLPQYQLRVDDKGDIYADGIDELLYGRLSNVL